MHIQLDHRAVDFRRVGDEVVALDLEHDAYLAVDGAGRVLWEMLAEGTDLEAMVATLVDTYDITEAVARTDVGAFVDDLRGRGLLVEGNRAVDG